MGNGSSRSPAMAYKDGSMWVSSFDDAGNRCWKNSQTGEKAYHLEGGRTSRRPSNTSVGSPYPMRSPAHGNGHVAPWATNAAAMHSPGPAAMHSPGPAAMHSPAPAPFYSPGPAAMHSAGPAVMRSPGPAAMHSPAPGAMHSPAPATMHSPGPAGFAAAHMHSPAPHTPSYAPTMAPYYQPNEEAGPPDANLAPTAAGQAVGYRPRKTYVMPRSKKAWMWTQH